jgi:N utilization substance protein B
MSTARTPKRSLARSAARLAAVQALYQREMEGTALTKLLDEFHQHRLGKGVEDEKLADAEVEFFDDIVSGVNARIEEIDAMVGERLSEGWSFKRLDKTLAQILRAGTYELLARNDVPVGAVISEYVDVAHAFFDEREAKFVNGVLDAVAKAVR